MADTSNEEIFLPDTVDREEDAMVLVSRTDSGTFLNDNGIESGDYGTLALQNGNTYTYVKNCVDSQGNEYQKLTVVNCDTQEVIVQDYNEEGHKIVTVYTTDPETTGYSVDTTELGMGLKSDGTLADPTLGIGVDLDPSQLRNAYQSGGNYFLEQGDVSSTAGVVDNFGNVTTVSGSFLKYSSDDSIVESQIFNDTFSNYATSAGISYNSEDFKTFTDYYEFEQQYDVYENMTANFNNSITQTFENNDITWGNIDTSFNNIMDLYKDAFYVGNLNISNVAEPIKDALKEAKTKIDTYLEEVSTEYARIAGEKEKILAELAALEAQSSGGGSGDTGSGAPGVDNEYHTLN